MKFQAVRLREVVHVSICPGGGRLFAIFLRVPLCSGPCCGWLDMAATQEQKRGPGVSITPQSTNTVLFKPLHIIYLSDFLHEDNPQTLNN